MLAVVYVDWSVLAGQTLGQWGPKFPGFFQLSLRLEIFNYCPAGSVAEFVFFSGGFAFHSFLWTFRLHIYIYRSGHIVVK